MSLRDQLPETFRAIDSFHGLIFGSPVPRDEAIRWVHQQLEQACEPVHPLKSVMAEWERHLAHNRVTAYSDMAGPHRCTVEKIVENQRPKPSWVYRPLLIPRPDKQPPALCDFVLILCVLHDGIGYPESPLKPERPVNEMLNWRWRDCWEQGFDEQPCPLPEDPAKDWHPKPLLRDHLEPRIGDWFRQVDAAFRKDFGLPAETQVADIPDDLNANEKAVLQSLAGGPQQRLPLYRIAISKSATNVPPSFDRRVLDGLRKRGLILKGKSGRNSPGIELSDSGYQVARAIVANKT